MFTYVINTSENKTFDSDRLFDLAGYNKISWKNCRLNQISECAQEIMERQNVLVAEDFSVAIIVDFFGFNRIRAPYGRNGFGKEEGVDLSIYIPYIEAYIVDKMVAYLEKYEIFAAKYEVYYVQSEKFERYEFLDNRKEQLHQILSGKEEAKCDVRTTEEKINRIINERLEIAVKEENLDKAMEKIRREEIRKQVEIEEIPYSTFSLYCTPEVTLDFSIKEYPYGTNEASLTFNQFFDAFQERRGTRSKITQHHYLTAYGGGPIRAAFDTLCLSLYLIYIYEREEIIEEQDEFEIAHLDSAVLKETLQTAWAKIAVARSIASENQSLYFLLDQNAGEIHSDLVAREEISPELAIMTEKANLIKDVKSQKISADTMYHAVRDFASKTRITLDEEKREQFDELMKEYLKKRDSTNETRIEAEFEELKAMGVLRTTAQCPSREKYNYYVEKKENEISELFDKVLSAEYIDVDFTEEKEKVEEAYKKYNEIRACMHKNFIGDIIFLIFSVLSAVIPYNLLQLKLSSLFVLSASTLQLATLAIFGGLFLLSFSIHFFIFSRKLKKQKDIIRDCYTNCLAKEKYSFSAIRNRYERDLIRIEEARFEILQIKHLYEANLKKDRNVMLHRNMLEEIHDKLSSMLSNMEVEPILDPNESVHGEFDLSKSFRAKDNKIYQIFSVEAIEKMFHKKGGNKN